MGRHEREHHLLERARLMASHLSTPFHKYAGIRWPLHPCPLRSAPCDVESEYPSVARLAGMAQRRSRCVTVYMKRGTY